MQFTWDACADNEGSVARCTQYNCPAKPFITANVKGHHVWMFPTHDIAEDCVTHFFQQWSQPDSSTSACVLVPQSLSYLMNKFDGLARLIAKYPVKSKVLTTADNKHTL